MSITYIDHMMYILKWGYSMKIVRMRLKEYLTERHMSRYALAKKAEVKYQTIDGYYKNTVTRYDSVNLGKIITALDCRIEDILEIVEET